MKTLFYTVQYRTDDGEEGTQVFSYDVEWQVAFHNHIFATHFLNIVGELEKHDASLIGISLMTGVSALT